jgi:transcriptional regulator with XRE-family HTH domain
MILTDAHRIRIIRAILGWDSKTFAARLGVCAGTMTAWEKGRSSPQGTKKQELAELCQEYGIGFTPGGFPIPFADVLILKQQETTT